jgi:hypothetical protein
MRRSYTRLLALFLGLVFLASAEAGSTLLSETFAKALDTGRWDLLRVNDTRSDRIEAGEGKLAVALETLGTDDTTVKVRGVRTKDTFELGETPLSFATTVDWNQQSNGCYQSAGLALVPEDYALDKDPRKTPEGIYFEWIGVPPGKNVRPYLAKRHANGLVELYTEGWPQEKREDRKGREPSKTKVTLEVGKDSVRLLEGEKELFKGKDAPPVGKYRLVIFASSHSNYPKRTVYFEGCEVGQVKK